MRLLLDENLDRKLKRFFGEEHEVRTVREVGWGSKKDGELLRLAEREFDALAAMDRSIPHQQNLSEIDMAVIVLEAPSNRISDLTPLVGDIEAALSESRPGESRASEAVGECLASAFMRIVNPPCRGWRPFLDNVTFCCYLLARSKTAASRASDGGDGGGGTGLGCQRAEKWR